MTKHISMTTLQLIEVYQNLIKKSEAELEERFWPESVLIMKKRDIENYQQFIEHLKLIKS